MTLDAIRGSKNLEISLRKKTIQYNTLCARSTMNDSQGPLYTTPAKLGHKMILCVGTG